MTWTDEDTFLTAYSTEGATCKMIIDVHTAMVATTAPVARVSQALWEAGRRLLWDFDSAVHDAVR